MRDATIRVGDLLKLKPSIYPPEYEYVQVAKIEQHSRYKHLWFYTATGEAFRGRDFLRHARSEEIAT